MQLKFQVLDCDYFMNGTKPVIRIFGKTENGKSVCAFVNGMRPYFYVLLEEKAKDRDGNEAKPKELLNTLLQKEFPGIFIETEGVDRFLPIGYHNKKTRLIKITLTEPSKVPIVREELRKRPFVKDVYEADVLFKYRFMVNRDISGMGFVKVEGTPMPTNTVNTTYKIEVSHIEPYDTKDDCELKHMAVDIEVASSREGLPDPRMDAISMISMAFYPKYKSHESMVFVAKRIKDNNDKSIRVFDSEKEMLEEFLKTIKEFDPDTVIGYNINGFDLPYIIERYRQNRMQPILGRCEKKSATSRKFGMRSRSDITGRVVVDAYDLVKESASKGLIKLKRYGLGDVSKALLGEDKVDIAHSEIVKYWNGDAAKMNKLISYSRKDSVLVLRLILERNFLDKFIELSKVSGILLQDALSSGEAARVENLLLKEFNLNEFVIPCRPTPAETSRRMVERETKMLKGAIVLEPETGLHTECIVYLDFKSMYPSIYISYNICTTTLIGKETDGKDIMKDIIETPYGVRFVSKKTRKGIIPKIVRDLIIERDLIKKEMEDEPDDEKRRQLNSKQVALKIMSNAFYGYTGYIRAKLYMLDIANGITSCGRYLIQKTRDTVDEEKEFRVIYGDTDSVMVKTKTKDIDEAYVMGQAIEKKINDVLKGIVKIKIEGIFKTIIILTKKRYAGWNFEKRGDIWEDKLIMKGIETVRRDWCDLVSGTLYNVLEIVLKEQDPKKAFDHVRDVLKQLQNNEISIERLIITKSMTKSVESYKGLQPHIEVVKKMRSRNPTDAPGVGDRVGYVITQGLQLLSNRAEDPEYVKAHGLKIDSKYYIENQLIPPLERVFDAMDIDKYELLGTGKQMNLMSMLNIKSGQKNIQQKSLETPLVSIDGLICNKCQKTYKRPPLIGKCVMCGGGLLFYKGSDKSKFHLA